MSDTDPNGLSWPLVERRQGDGAPPEGVERRSDRRPGGPEDRRGFDDRRTPERRSDDRRTGDRAGADRRTATTALQGRPDGGPDRRRATSSRTTTLTAAPMWPFRLAALVGALVGAVGDISHRRWSVAIIAGLAIAYTTFACLRPTPYRNEQHIRARILAEEALAVVAVVFTGAWNSPFVLFFIPTGMLAGFAVGAVYSGVMSLTAVVFATAPHIANIGWEGGLRDGALWAALLSAVAYTSGLVRKAATEAERQQAAARDRMSDLAEANSLLAALQRVAQSMPASLDLDDVLDSSMGRLRTMTVHDALDVYLVDPTTDRLVLSRSSGPRPSSAFPLTAVPACLRNAMDSPKPVRIDQLAAGHGLDPDARSGIYAGLRARGALVGVIAVESHAPMAYDPKATEVVHGLTEPFGIAIDNARLFQSIRTLAADEERMRIARDLHDHIGSSLALIGFEVDAAIATAGAQGDVEPDLRQVREHVSTVVGEVRDTLYDLRTDVSDRNDLARTVADFLARVGPRSDLQVSSTVMLEPRLAPLVEREVWQMVREAIRNTERHARATMLHVEAYRRDNRVVVTVTDDGVGLAATDPRSDSYGLTGMRERAMRIGATLSVGPPAGRNGTGTEVRIELPGGTS